MQPLFRGKTPEGKWVYGYYYQDDRKSYIMYTKVVSQFLGINWISDMQHEVIPESVGQWTGLEDKKGKQCYKGDIVSGYPYGGSKKQLGEIVWCDILSGWITKFPTLEKHICDIANCTEPNSPEDYSFEIIGNVTDNPDLLIQ